MTPRRECRAKSAWFGSIWLGFVQLGFTLCLANLFKVELLHFTWSTSSHSLHFFSFLFFSFQTSAELFFLNQIHLNFCFHFQNWPLRFRQSNAWWKNRWNETSHRTGESTQRQFVIVCCACNNSMRVPFKFQSKTNPHLRLEWRSVILKMSNDHQPLNRLEQI